MTILRCVEIKAQIPACSVQLTYEFHSENICFGLFSQRVLVPQA